MLKPGAIELTWSARRGVLTGLTKQVLEPRSREN